MNPSLVRPLVPASYSDLVSNRHTTVLAFRVAAELLIAFKCLVAVLAFEHSLFGFGCREKSHHVPDLNRGGR